MDRALRNLLLSRVNELQKVQEARTLVQERYLDGHDAMFPDLASAWDERVHCTQEIAAMAVRLAEIDGVAPAAEPGPEAISRRTAELVADLVEPAKPRPSRSSAKDANRSRSRLAGWGRSWHRRLLLQPRPGQARA